LHPASVSGAPAGVLQRQPKDKKSDPTQPSPEEAKEMSRMDDLARDPCEAHRAWKRLTWQEKLDVQGRLAALQGDAFSKQFLDAEQKGKVDCTVAYLEPGRAKRDQLLSWGYRYFGEELTGTGDIVIEIWFHPTGKKIRRDISTVKWGGEPKTPGTTDKPGVPPKEPPIKEPPTKELPKVDCATLKQQEKTLREQEKTTDISNPALMNWEFISAEIDELESGERTDPSGTWEELANYRGRLLDYENVMHQVQVKCGEDDYLGLRQDYFFFQARYNDLVERMNKRTGESVPPEESDE